MAEKSALAEIDRQLQDIGFRKGFGAEKATLLVAMALVDAREQSWLTQKQLADLAGVTQSWTAELEQSDANPTIGKVGSLLALMWKRLEFTSAPLTKREPTVAGRVVRNRRGHRTGLIGEVTGTPSSVSYPTTRTFPLASASRRVT
ncbi:MAG: helix-turn-helix domain-containing protein [SAR202 cluster bacterium]|nr:helix-turn-helix domain-containing protein [SAR202 cluster bacterium]